MNRQDIEYIAAPLTTYSKDLGFESIDDISKWLSNFVKGIYNLLTDFKGTLDRIIGEKTQTSIMKGLEEDYEKLNVIISDPSKFQIVKDMLVRLPIGSSENMRDLSKQLLFLGRIQQATMIEMDSFSSFISRILTEDGFDSSEIAVNYTPNITAEAMDEHNRDLIKLMNGREVNVKFSKIFKYPAQLEEVINTLKEVVSDADLHYARVELPENIDAQYKKIDKILTLEKRGGIELSDIRKKELYARAEHVSALITLYGKYVATMINELSAISAVRNQIVE